MATELWFWLGMIALGAILAIRLVREIKRRSEWQDSSDPLAESFERHRKLELRSGDDYWTRHDRAA
jgi:hypothetical protein